MAVTRALLLLLGLAVAGWGIYWLRRRRKLARASGVPGTIVDVERRFTGKSNAYFPVVSFRTRDGAEVRAVAPQGKVFWSPKVGKPVTVLYDPADPARAYIDSAGLRFGPAVFVAVGLGFVILAALPLR